MHLGFEGGLAASSVVGGFASVAGGGKFADGAVTAAFGYLFNDYWHRARMQAYGTTVGFALGSGAAFTCAATTVGTCAFGPAEAMLNGFTALGGGVGWLVGAFGDLISGTWDTSVLQNRMTPDQQALKELVDEATNGARKPLPVGDAETILDWADETKYPGVRAGAGDVARPSNWDAGAGQPHIHVPGIGTGHIPVEDGVKPRP
jgi:hypothetical protein